MRHEDEYNFFSRIIRRILYLFDASWYAVSGDLNVLLKPLTRIFGKKHGNEGIHTVGHQPKIKPHLNVQSTRGML